MKRIAIAVLALFTSLSVSTGSASGQAWELASSDNEGTFRTDLLEMHLNNPDSDTAKMEPASSVQRADEVSVSIKENSSQEVHNAAVDSSWGIAKSSIKQDVENNEPMGTNLNEFLAIGGIVTLAVVLYGIALQAGVPLPYISAI